MDFSLRPDPLQPPRPSDLLPPHIEKREERLRPEREVGLRKHAAALIKRSPRMVIASSIQHKRGPLSALTAEAMFRHAQDKYLTGYSLPRIRAVPLAEMGGKVRVASLHPAEEVHLARHLTARWMPVLKHLKCHRDLLRGREITLLPLIPRDQQSEPELFSADMAASTDPIPHDIARQVWAFMMEKGREPAWVREAGHKILGPKTVQDGTGRATKRGIHMGLGVSWIILSLLNSFAAWNAGATKDSYRICGDDLIGFWPRETFQAYARTLKELGMAINDRKTFSGPRGVFCERLVVIHADGAARSTQRFTLAEATAAKTKAGLTDHLSPSWMGCTEQENATSAIPSPPLHAPPSTHSTFPHFRTGP